MFETARFIDDCQRALAESDPQAAVRELVLGERLVTITGPGGVGKSSLAIEVARAMAEDLETAFVPIEDNREADPWKVIATSVGLQGGDDTDLPHLVTETIGETSLLMLLDGCEHFELGTASYQSSPIASRPSRVTSAHRMLLSTSGLNGRTDPSHIARCG